MKIKIAFILFLSLTLCSCAQPTPYVKRDIGFGSKYGYTDKQISNDEYAIIAEGNVHSTPQHIAKLAVYRAAKLTIEKGNKYFEITQSRNKELTNHQLISIPIGIPILFVPVAETETNEPTSILIIRLLKGEQSQNENAIDATEVVRKLAPEFNNSD